MRPHAVSATNPEPAATTWAIHDPVIRFRVHGTERVLDLASFGQIARGSVGPDLDWVEVSGRVDLIGAARTAAGVHAVGIVDHPPAVVGPSLDQGEVRQAVHGPRDGDELTAVQLILDPVGIPATLTSPACVTV